MENNKTKTYVWLIPAVLVFLAAFRPIFEVGSFIFHSDNMLPWIAAGSSLGLILAVAATFEIRANRLKRMANISIFFSVIASGVLFGASLYASTWANQLWSASPPASFTLIQPPYDVGFSLLYVFFNSLLEMAVLLALFLNWRVPRRRNIIIVLAVTYLTMRVWTYIYFLPNVIDFLTADTTEPFSPELKARADEWVYLSYYRTAIDGIANALFLATTFIPFS